MLTNEVEVKLFFANEGLFVWKLNGWLFYFHLQRAVLSMPFSTPLHRVNAPETLVSSQGFVREQWSLDYRHMTYILHGGYFFWR